MPATDLIAATFQLLHAGSWLQAEASAQAVREAEPGDAQGDLLAGLAIAAMGEAERAAPLLAAAAAARPEAEHPCRELARLRLPLPRALVARQFRACLDLAPADSRLRRAFAGFLLEADDPEAAEAVLGGMPGDAAAQHLKGMARTELNRFASAISSFKIAVALNPSAAASWSNLGIVLKVEGEFQKAIIAHDRAVALEPENPQFRVNRAVALLQAGAWERAWQDYEYRMELAAVPGFDRSRLLPTLAGGFRLAGRTVLALHEEGFGDTLQFLRYLPLLAELGARVIACVPRELVRVMGLVPGVAEVVTDAAALPAHDYVCPMFSLPRVFSTTVATIPPVPDMAFDGALPPAPTPDRHFPACPGHLLRQVPAEVARASRAMTAGVNPGDEAAVIGEDAVDGDAADAETPRQPPGPPRRIGLVWAGQARPTAPGFRTLDRRRSAGLAAFAPLAQLPGMTFVSLQAGPPARQPAPEGLVLEDAMPGVTDFLDTAAIIATLDAVVSVDTSVVHLAGLMGKPVLLADRYDGCWRWLHGRTDSPWYPRLRIFRQDNPGDWSGPMARIAAALDAGTVFSEIVTELA
nr:tetratricopeptide repeat-containing glycosyltransferase family protein [uncultured Rhodopila sp.]